jgi:succinate dehydrogenase / fumarate reductase cytochrome b subunit
MTWKEFFSASIGKKITMAFTGLFLILFLIVHAGINACIFLGDNGETFNQVAHFMGHNWIMRFLEVGLFTGFIIHIAQGLILVRQNQTARPVGYYMNKPEKNSKWYSRSMGLLGTLLLIFLIIHLSHFYVGSRAALYGGYEEPSLFIEMQQVFSNGWVVLIYMVGLVALFWHLKQGFQSAFQTLGINHKRYTPLLKTIGLGYSIIICVLFAMMPLAFYFDCL